MNIAKKIISALVLTLTISNAYCGTAELISAVNMGSSSDVQYYLDGGANPNAKVQGTPLVMFAIKKLVQEIKRPAVSLPKELGRLIVNVSFTALGACILYCSFDYVNAQGIDFLKRFYLWKNTKAENNHIHDKTPSSFRSVANWGLNKLNPAKFHLKLEDVTIVAAVLTAISTAYAGFNTVGSATKTVAVKPYQEIRRSVNVASRKAVVRKLIESSKVDLYLKSNDGKTVLDLINDYSMDPELVKHMSQIENLL